MSKWAPNASERAFLDVTIARCLDALKGELTDRQTFARDLRNLADSLDRSPAVFPIAYPKPEDRKRD